MSSRELTLDDRPTINPTLFSYNVNAFCPCDVRVDFVCKNTHATSTNKFNNDIPLIILLYSQLIIKSLV